MSKASSIEWAKKSWNPINGRCPNDCRDLQGEPYCYMWGKGGIANRFKDVHDHPLRLDEKVLKRLPKKGNVFIGSATDMFCDQVPDEWIKQVFRPIYYRQHLPVKYFFLTKNPYRYIELVKHEIYPPIFQYYGTTWDGTEKTKDNIAILKCFHDDTTEKEVIYNYRKFISFEPLLADPAGLDISGIKWIIIGSDSRAGKPKPPKEWADYLIAEARRNNIAVWVKDNYGYPEIIKEHPF